MAEHGVLVIAPPRRKITGVRRRFGPRIAGFGEDGFGRGHVMLVDQQVEVAIGAQAQSAECAQRQAGTLEQDRCDVGGGKQGDDPLDLARQRHFREQGASSDLNQRRCQRRRHGNVGVGQTFGYQRTDPVTIGQREQSIPIHRRRCGPGHDITPTRVAGRPNRGEQEIERRIGSVSHGLARVAVDTP